MISVYSLKNQKVGEVEEPIVFSSPIRPDLIGFVHTNMRKNSRQPHGTMPGAGYGNAATSWGPGRAVARVPRVHGAGTRRAGQGALVNSCRKGRMFSPIMTTRRWGRRINIRMRRFAIVSALAATAQASIVAARGHRIESLNSFPLVVDDALESISKTQDAIDCLKTLGLEEELKRTADVKMRAGKGKRRNRRYVKRCGVLICYSKDDGVVRSFRNIRGVSLMAVDKMDLLRLTPGGHLGRLVVWTRSAFERLSELYPKEALPLPDVVMADSKAILETENVSSVLEERMTRTFTKEYKEDPFKNPEAMARLNPLMATSN